MASIFVLGGGFGGMAAALRARALGHSVTLIDRQSKLGGRAQVFEKAGYRHDAGPTVITAPFLFDELFSLFNRKREDYVDFKPLEVWYQFLYNDGSHFNYGGSADTIEAEIAKVCESDVAGYRALVDASKAIYQVGFEELAHRPFHRLWAMLSLMPKMIRLKSYQSVWDLVCQFIQSPKLQRAFSIQPLLVGGNPFDTTSIYNLIHFLERKHGIHFAMGGTGALVAALEKLMDEVGIEVIKETTVTAFDVRDGVINLIKTDSNKHYACDHVISNLDPAFLYQSLLSNNATMLAKMRCRYAKKSMGLFVLFFGTNKQYQDVEHHTIVMGESFKGLLDDIFHHKKLNKDISIYLHRPTATDASFAPDGCDSFYALVPVPNLQGGQEWETAGEQLKSWVIERLENTLLPGLTNTIEHPFYMTPKDFKHEYLSPDGAGFSIAPTFYQSAWFRFHNKGEGISNLSLVGAGSHPGAGLPGVLSSAKVVEGLLKTQYRPIKSEQTWNTVKP